MKKILPIVVVVSLLSSSAGFAAESDFYVKADAGLSKFGDIESAKSRKNVVFGLGAGYNYMDNVRLDLIFDHYVNPKFKSGDVKITGEINTLMLNAFVDLFDISIAKVFVGSGVGLGQIKAKISSHTIPVIEPDVDDGQQQPADVIKNSIAKLRYKVAYSAYFGSSVEFAPGVTAETIYSYRIMGKTSKIQNSLFEFRGHNLRVGIRFDL